MGKFILRLTKGDDRKVLSVHETKEEAFTEGEQLFEKLGSSKGLISVIEAEIDENNNIIGNRYRLYHLFI